MYLATIGEQSRIFLYSVGLGFFLGFVFDAFTLTGLFLPKKKAVTIVLDCVYMIVCTFLIFFFGLAVHNGSFRLYVYCAVILGWLIRYYSFGAFVRRVSKALSVKIKSVLLLFTEKTRKKQKKIEKN